VSGFVVMVGSSFAWPREEARPENSETDVAGTACLRALVSG